MEKNHSSKLAQDLEPLQQRIAELKAKRRPLEQELHQAEAELEALEKNRSRYDALQEVCAALGKLEDQDAKKLFWDQLPQVENPDESLDRLCRLPDKYHQDIKSKLEKIESLKVQIHAFSTDLYHLDGQVDEAYLREQKRLDAFVVEREVPFFPMHAAVMPWSKETESERLFRRSLLVALLICLLLGGLVPLVSVPVPDRITEVVEIPERIAKLVKAPPVIEEAPPAPQIAEEEPKKDEEEKPEEKKPEPEKKAKAEETARQKAQKTGVLAFKESFKDLIVDAPTTKVGDKALIVNKAATAAGNQPSRRSLVAMQATGTSGGIRASAVSRAIGSGEGGGSGQKIGAVAFSRVESAVAEMAEKKGSTAAAGQSPGRSDEEIQIVFDRYKATLYRIYNKELRKDPSVRGNIILRITIEPGGEVSACKVESTDLKSPELVKKIVARVSRINFGPKKGVAKITILYPIDFLPAG